MKITCINLSILLLFALNIMAQQKDELKVTIQNAYPDRVEENMIAFSADKKIIVTKGEDEKGIRIWNDRGILIRSIPIEFDPIQTKSLAVSNDGFRVAIAHKEILEIWDTKGIKLIEKKYTGDLDHVNFTNTNTVIVSNNNSKVLFIGENGITNDSIIVNSPNKSFPWVRIVWLKHFSNDDIYVLIRVEGKNDKNEQIFETWLIGYNAKKELILESKLEITDYYFLRGFSSSFDNTKGLFNFYSNPEVKTAVFKVDFSNKTITKLPINGNEYYYITGDGNDVFIPEKKFKSDFYLDGFFLHYSKEFYLRDNTRSFSFYDSKNGIQYPNYGIPLEKYFGSAIFNSSCYYAIQLNDGYKYAIQSSDDKENLIWTLNQISTTDLSISNIPNHKNVNCSNISFNPNFSSNSNEPYALVSYDKDRFVSELFFVDQNWKGIKSFPFKKEWFDNWKWVYHISPNGQYIVAVQRHLACLIDFNGKIIKEIDIRESKNSSAEINSFSFSKDGNLFLLASKDGISTYNSKGKRLNNFDLKSFNYSWTDYISAAAIDPNSNNIVIIYKGDIYKTDINGNIFSKSNGNLPKIDKLSFTPDGNFIVGISNDRNIIVLDSSGNFLRLLDGHADVINSIKISADSKYITSTSDDNSLKIWKIDDGYSITLIGDDKDWIIFTPDGYYDASTNGGKFVGMTVGREGFAIDQFAAKYNRPDIILKKMGLGNPDAIKHFENQYKKRLRKLGLTEERLSSDFHVPTSQITSTNLNNKHLSVNALLNDEKYNLTRYNIYVNDVPIFGAYGKEISGKKVSIQDIVELTSGNNKIEVSCINEQGAESYRALAYANCNVESKGNLYLLAFGVSKYNNESLNLQFAHKDALDLEKVIQNMKGKGFENVYTKVLTNEQVTPDAIKTSKDFVKNAKPDDTFILFIAGHGMHDKDAEATYYYLTSNADVNNLKGTAADFETIEDLLQGIPPRNKLFLMDACESGEIDEEDQGQMLAAATGVGIASRGFKSTTVVTPSGVEGTKAKRPYLYQKDRYIYNDLVRRSGAIVFSSSKGGELSYERSDIQNGLFTYWVMKALTTKEADKDNNGLVSTDELRQYVSEQVAKASGDLQHPTVDRDNIYQKFGFGI